MCGRVFGEGVDGVMLSGAKGDTAFAETKHKHPLKPQPQLLA